MKKFFEKHDLVKLVLIALVITIVLTWIVPSGVYQTGTIDGQLARTGIVDFFLSGMMSVSFFLQQLVFVILVGAFYGVMIRAEGYKKLVEKLSKNLKGREIPFLLITSLLVAGFTSITTNIFVVVLFIPFLIHVLKKMGLDNMTAFVSTFGSMLIGVLGATYGTEGLISFVNYLTYYSTTNVKVELAVRGGILLLAFILFNFFNITHARKVLSSKNEKKDSENDLFVVEEPKKKTSKAWPMVLGFLVLLIFAILGYVNWAGNFNITIFSEFHAWLMEFEVAEHQIFSYILGTNAAAFGEWQLYHMVIIMGIVLLITAIIYHINFDNLIEGIYDGVKKMMKPVGIMLLIYMIFVFMYWSPVVPTIVSWIAGENFNPFTSTLAASISSLFHIDFGYTGYAVGNLLATYEGASFNIAYVIYVTINGLVSMFTPTSIVLMLGLSYCDIPYKKWFAYIWKFLLGMLVCLLVIFALLTYI